MASARRRTAGIRRRRWRVTVERVAPGPTYILTGVGVLIALLASVAPQYLSGKAEGGRLGTSLGRG